MRRSSSYITYLKNTFEKQRVAINDLSLLSYETNELETHWIILNNFELLGGSIQYITTKTLQDVLIQGHTQTVCKTVLKIRNILRTVLF